MSILVVGFIKAEVILSFLGFGVPVGVVSWGSMLNEAQNELILGRWWQLTAAAVAMACWSRPSRCSPMRCAMRSIPR
jgi:peptide/nickel transport system permease protein